MNFQGCIPSQFDMRDYSLANIDFSTLPKQYICPIPAQMEYIRVKNQRQIPSCVAHALSTILEYHSNSNDKLSTNFIYGNRSNSYNKNYKGMSLKDACQIAQKLGDALEEDCPGNSEYYLSYQLAQKAKNNLVVMKKAENYKIKNYILLKNINEIKYSILNHGPALIAIPWYQDSKCEEGFISSLQRKNPTYHALVAYGWNEQGLLIQNSWGYKWGEFGRAILPYDYPIKEARGIIDLEDNEIKTYNRKFNILFKILNFIINLFKR